MASTRPDGPAKPAAENVKSPTFAPTSQTVQPGRTYASAKRVNSGSIVPASRLRYLSPPSVDATKRAPPRRRGRRLVKVLFRPHKVACSRARATTLTAPDCTRPSREDDLRHAEPDRDRRNHRRTAQFVKR